MAGMQKDCRNNPCQRFGSAPNLNIHLHMLVLDGAYTFTHDRARFHHAPAPSDAELVRLLDTLIRRITRTLVRAGVLVEDPEQPWLDLEPGSTLEHLAAAAVRYRIALGPMPKRKTLTLHNPGAVSGARESAKPLTAARDGFSLNAAVACKDHERDKLEHLCRYVSRGPIALERLSIDGDGLVVYALKHPFRDRLHSRAVRATRLYRSPRRPGATPAHPLGALPWIVRAKFETSPPHCRQPVLATSARPRRAGQ